MQSTHKYKEFVVSIILSLTVYIFLIENSLTNIVIQMEKLEYYIRGIDTKNQENNETLTILNEKSKIKIDEFILLKTEKDIIESIEPEKKESLNSIDYEENNLSNIDNEKDNFTKESLSSIDYEENNLSNIDNDKDNFTKKSLSSIDDEDDNIPDIDKYNNDDLIEEPLSLTDDEDNNIPNHLSISKIYCIDKISNYNHNNIDKPTINKVYRTNKLADSYYFLLLDNNCSYYQVHTNKTKTLIVSEIKSPSILKILDKKQSWGHAFLSKGKYIRKNGKIYTKKLIDRIKASSPKKIKYLNKIFYLQ